MEDKEKPKWTLKDFQNLSMLGRGQDGVIYKALDPYSRVEVAIKLMPKKNYRNQRLRMQLQREIEIHSRLKYPYIVEMYGWFQNQHNVFLVLQYCKGVSLFNQLRVNKKVLKEAEIKVYMKQLALAVAYLHERNVIHRDLKLENVMVTPKGLKLIDFGWCVHSIAEQRRTLCGTPDYLPPEMVRRNKYDYKVDIYSLGVVFYELFEERAPYTDITDQRTFDNILEAKLIFKKEIDSRAQELIRKMMNPVAKERLWIKEVLEHPYLADVELELDKL